MVFSVKIWRALDAVTCLLGKGVYSSCCVSGFVVFSVLPVYAFCFGNIQDKITRPNVEAKNSDL